MLLLWYLWLLKFCLFQQQSSTCGYSWHSAEARGYGAWHVPECGDETHRNRQGKIAENVCHISNSSFRFFASSTVFFIFLFFLGSGGFHEMNVLGFIPLVTLIANWWACELVPSKVGGDPTKIQGTGGWFFLGNPVSGNQPYKQPQTSTITLNELQWRYSPNAIPTVMWFLLGVRRTEQLAK